MMSTELKARRGREGSRWVNERPTEREVAKWFADVPLHDGMEHARYVNGITLIPAVEKVDEIAGYDDNGRPVVVEDVRNMTWTPYMKVETRVAYFHDYARRIEEQWPDGLRSVIEPVPVPGSTELGLPDGFFAFRASHASKGEVKFIGARYRVAITTMPKWVSAGVGGGLRVMESTPIVEGVGTKIVATASKWDVDANSVMKAETGAIGRALGVAGMLVLPGSGIATAEDMLEAMGPAPAASPADAALPADAEPAVERQLSDPELRDRAGALLQTFDAEYPEAAARFREWAKGRGHAKLSDLTSPALKGFVRKLEKELDTARQEAGS